MGLFARRPLVDDDFAEFAFECFGWLRRHLPSGYAPRLVQPTDEFFPQRGLRGLELAEALFEQVKGHAGLRRWKCRLEAQEEDPSHLVAPLVVVQNVPASPAGTFSWKDEPVITYKPKLVADPMVLVAVFAHELAHYLTRTFKEPPPRGMEHYEYATDVAGVFLGFGVFAANSCFHFHQYNQAGVRGWQTERRGYLTEPQLLFALALFAALRELPQSEVLPHLKPALRGSYKRACKEIQARAERLEALKQVRSTVTPAV